MIKTIRWATIGILLLVTCGFLIFSVAAKLSRSEGSMTQDEKLLRQLNDEYIDAFLKADVGWYQKHLADDFICIESSGAVLDKPQFLRDAAKGPDVADYKLDQVRVRIYGDAALVQATGVFTRRDGSVGKSRYIDVYVRSGKEWKAVSAQITRVAGPAQ